MITQTCPFRLKGPGKYVAPAYHTYPVPERDKTGMMSLTSILTLTLTLPLTHTRLTSPASQSFSMVSMAVRSKNSMP